MNRFTRILTVGGLGLIAGVTMGAGPAMAAVTSDAGTSKTSSAAQDNRRDRVVGFYGSYGACVLAGRIGERFGHWDSFDCDRVGRRTFALEVSWDRDWRFGDRHRGHDRPWFNDRDRDHRGDRDRDRDHRGDRGRDRDRDHRGDRDRDRRDRDNDRGRDRDGGRDRDRDGGRDRDSGRDDRPVV